MAGNEVILSWREGTSGTKATTGGPTGAGQPERLQAGRARAGNVFRLTVADVQNGFGRARRVGRQRRGKSSGRVFALRLRRTSRCRQNNRQVPVAQQRAQTVVPVGDDAQFEAAPLEWLQTRRHVVKHPPGCGGGKVTARSSKSSGPGAAGERPAKVCLTNSDQSDRL